MVPKRAYFATPAFANTISSLPFSRLICAKSRSRSPRFDTCPWTPVTLLPISFTARASSESRRPVMKTYAPSLTNCFAVARPMPPLPPVMSAIFPSSLPIYFSLLDNFLVLYPDRGQIALQLWRQRFEPRLFLARPRQHVAVFHHIVRREVAEIDPDGALLHSGDFTYRPHNAQHQPLSLFAGSSRADVGADPDLVIRPLAAKIALTLFIFINHHLCEPCRRTGGFAVQTGDR